MNRATGLFVFLVLFAVYVWTASPAVSWFDTGELAAGALLLGNGHPPGQPVYALLAKVATLIPLGSIPLRLAVLSAAAGAAAMALLGPALARLAGRLGMPAPGAAPRWGAPLIAGLTLPVWLQCVRVELYALQLLLSVGAVWVALGEVRDGRSRARRDWTLGWLLGLSAATHPLLGVLLVPGLLLVTHRLSWSSLPRWAGGAFLSGSAYLYLPIRARAGALLNWGNPDTWERFLDVITGKAYQHSFATLTWGRFQENLALHGALFLGLLGIPLLVLALGGLVLTFKRGRLGVGMVLLIAGNVASTASQSAFFPDNPDALGYLALTAALLVLLAALALTWLDQRACELKRSGRLRPWVIELGGAAVVVALAGGVAFTSRPRTDFHDNWYYQTYVRQLLHPLPVGCLELSGSDSSTFAGWYGLAVEGMRPDVGVLSLYTLPETEVFKVGNLPDTLPELPETDPGTQVRALVSRMLPLRPVHVTMHDFPVDLAFAMRLDVTSFRLVPPGGPVPLDDGIEILEQFWTRQARRIRDDPAYRRDRQARLRFPAHLEAAGDYLLELGLPVSAMRAYTAAEAFALDPYRLVHLKRLRLEERMAEIRKRGGLVGVASDGQQAPDAGPRKRLMTLLELGQWRETRGLVQQLPPDDAATLLARAWQAYLEGRWDDARDNLGRLRRVAPESWEAQVALTRLGRVLPSGEAVAWMAHYLAKHPSPSLQAALADRLREAGRVDEALRVARVAVSGNPDLVSAQVALGWALVLSGRLEEAFGVLQRALTVSPTDPSALRLASYLYRRGLR